MRSISQERSDMTITQWIVCTTLLLVSAVDGQALDLIPAPPTREAGPQVSGRYTAQRRPRVAVLAFEDANTEAQRAGYGASVQSMLVTFLKRESQFVVDERQKLGPLLGEKQRMQRGMVDIDPTDPAVRELLEKVDALIFGNVTLLDMPTEPATTRGQRIEIDAKLFSRLDGRITVAAPFSGPVGCLRSIVDRLGVTLEQEFLHPYYGQLRITLTEPENVGIFLTPIRLATERDEQKPPSEVGFTVTLGGERAHIEPWITNPTTYTIENLLSGWYSLSLKRPGYEELKTDAVRWEARDLSGKVEIYDRITGLPLASTDPELRRFVVRVDPGATEEIDGDARNFVLRKQGGFLAARMKGQYIDTDFTQVPQRVMLMGGPDLELNQPVELKQLAEDQQCGLFAPVPIVASKYSLTHIPAGQKFDFDRFTGGELIIEDYRGEVVPVGKYRLVLWEPNYEIAKSPAIVRDRVREVTRTSLTRKTLPLRLDATGPRPGSRVILKGRDTHYRKELSLDFAGTKEQRLPADVYTVSTNVPGLDGWKDSTELFPATNSPPTYYTRSSAYEPEISHALEDNGKPVRGPNLIVKTRFGLAGRLDVLSRRRDPLAADLFVDGEVPKLLDLLLHPGKQAPPPRDPNDLRELLARRLRIVDLLVLDARDMAQLRKSPEVAAIVRRFVDEGGALFAFVAEMGDYGEVVGAPLVVEAVGKPTDRFTLAPGDVNGFDLQLAKKVEVQSRRALPAVTKLSPQGPWRVLAFTEGREAPRIIERGRREAGGYVALWLDDPGSFCSPLGGTVPQVEAARAKLEGRILQRAKYLMVRRYDKGGAQRRKLEATLAW
jgi:curli production assembly/transport component CsgG